MGNMKDMQGMQGMDEMFEYTSKITFEHKVKGIKAKNITATQEPNAVIMKGRMQDMVKPNAELKIRLK
jgi:cytidylate kinase